jgi:site-specific DNA-methyltransferase (adenine-specific)
MPRVPRCSRSRKDRAEEQDVLSLEVFSWFIPMLVVNNRMRKSSATAKTPSPPSARKKATAVKEHEQLYLVRKPANGASAAGNGFRHHRPKEGRPDSTAEALDPTKALTEFADNKRGAINQLLSLNAYFRHHPWPAPFDATKHTLRLGDARDLSWIPNSSIHLVVTSPPYWTLKKYEDNKRQLGEIADYSRFLDELDKVWKECVRVLAPGGRICCVVGDVCIPRKRGRHHVMPLHADIMVRARSLGVDALTPILWFKIANGVTEAKGNGAGFYGKPYQPGAIIKNDAEYILFLRKGGEYRSPTPTQKALSMLSKDEMKSWLRSAWFDIKGESTRRGHPAPYPESLAERLIKLFSFAGDTVLDPFVGTGTTGLAAVTTGRNSIGIEIEPAYLKMAEQRLSLATGMPRMFGATHSTLKVER